MHAVDAAGAAEACALGEPLVEILVHQLFDLRFHIVGQLETGRAEQLDAVVVEQIMRGGNHHAEIGAHRFGQHRDRGRRHRAEQQHVHAHRGKARHHGVLDHVTGQTGVLADHHAMTMVAALETPARRPARP
jgi:hypothetical protein